MPAESALGRPNPGDRPNQIVGKIVLADGTKLRVTTHCVDRFWERAASGCSLFRLALERLQQLATAIGVEEAKPEWAGYHWEDERWISLGPDIGLIARKRTALTCITRDTTLRRTRSKI